MGLWRVKESQQQIATFAVTLWVSQGKWGDNFEKENRCAEFNLLAPFKVSFPEKDAATILNVNKEKAVCWSKVAEVDRKHVKVD